MKAYHNSVVLRNDGQDTATGKFDLNAGVTKQVTVRINSSQALAIVYDLNEVQIANPVTTDSNGNYKFKANDDIYDVIISEGGPDEYKIEKVDILAQGLTVGSLSSYTDYIFDTIDNMKLGLVVGGDSVLLKIGDRIRIEERSSSSFICGIDTANTNNVILTGVAGVTCTLEEKVQDKYSESININSVALPVSLVKNEIGANQDSHIHLWGDSHGWGQGAPGWDNIGTGYVNFSRHSAMPHNKGFNARIERFIKDKLNITENVYSLANNVSNGRITPADARSSINTDIDNTFPLKLEIGKLSSINSQLVDITANTFTNFYAPVTQFNVDPYSLSEYREKLSRGLFKNTIMELSPESLTDFNQQGKDYFVELTPDANYPGSGAGFTQVTFGSQATVVAEWNNTTNIFYIATKTLTFPQWFANGELIFISGYGVVEVVNILGNGAIQLRHESGSEIGSALAKYIYPGMKIYPSAYIKQATLRLEMVQEGRVSYISVRHQLNGGVLRVSWTDSISGGMANRPYLNKGVAFQRTANAWVAEQTVGVVAHLVVPGNILLSNPQKVTVTSIGVEIDTSQIDSTDQEVVYRIDWGSKQRGVLHLDAVPAAGKTVQTRGVIFDNNKVVNLSEGGHTVGAWLGNDNAADAARDHIADILKYTPVQPSHVITQIPFVNEYLNQTSIAKFEADLAEFVQRYHNHLSTSNNYNSVGVDFMFFTSLRNKGVAFQGTPSSPISYDDYVNATKNFCEVNGYSFVDCEQRLFDLVEQGRIDYQRLYQDSNHPSDYANEVIFNTLRSEYLEAQIG